MPLPDLRPQSELDAMDRIALARANLNMRKLPVAEAAMGLMLLVLFHLLV